MKKVLFLIFSLFTSSFVFAETTRLHELAKEYFEAENKKNVFKEARSLFDDRFDINAQDSNGNTALNLHVKFLIFNTNEKFDIKFLKFLLRRGSDITIKNYKEQTIFDFIFNRLKSLNENDEKLFIELLESYNQILNLILKSKKWSKNFPEKSILSKILFFNSNYSVGLNCFVQEIFDRRYDLLREPSFEKGDLDSLYCQEDIRFALIDDYDLFKKYYIDMFSKDNSDLSEKIGDILDNILSEISSISD